MDVSSNCGWCWWLQTCSAMADLSISPRRVAAICSFRRVSSILFVSPMYANPQLHGIRYTTPDLFRGGSLSLTLVSCWRRVVGVVKTVRIPCLQHILLRSSLRPETYGSSMVCFGSSSRSFFFLSFIDDALSCSP